jgi:peroxiredoxin
VGRAIHFQIIFMKNKLIFTSFVFILFTFTGIFAQTSLQRPDVNSSGLNINGKINGLKDGETVYLNIWDAKKRSDITVDSAIVTNGEFKLNYAITDAPRLFWIRFSKHHHIMAIPLGNESVSIVYEKNIDYLKDQSIFRYMNITGSEVARQFWYLEYGVKDCWYYTGKKLDNEVRKYKDSLLTKDNLSYIAGVLNAKDLLNKTIGEILLGRPVQENIPELFDNVDNEVKREGFFHDVFYQLPKHIQDSYYGKLMKEELPLCMGQPAPDFKFTTDAGKTITLKDVIKNNKVTILHFWSNGSVQRNRIQDELVNVYKKYKSKGLEVVSVSSDFNVNQWKNAVQVGKLPGYQIFDQKQDMLISEMYKIDPQWTINILIDQNGKMLRFDADGPALLGYLFQLFGE